MTITRNAYVALSPAWLDRLGLPPAVSHAASMLAGQAMRPRIGKRWQIEWNVGIETDVDEARIVLIEPQPERLPQIRYQDRQLVAHIWDRLFLRIEG